MRNSLTAPLRLQAREKAKSEKEAAKAEREAARAEKAEAKAAADAAKAAAKAPAEEAKAPKGPKKPRTAFIFFGDKTRPEVAAANPEAKAADVTKLLAERWKGMGADEKAEFVAAAEQDKEVQVSEATLAQ